jgi:hypothetical protein
MANPTDEEKLNFSARIEYTAKDLDISFWSALCYICEIHNYEVEVASTLLTQSLIDAIAEDVNKLKLLKHQANKIPGL